MIVASAPTSPSGESSSSPAEEQRELEDVRDRGDRPGDHRRDRRDEDVAVLDVRELVREHALDLVGRQVLQQPLRHRDGGVLRVAPGRERVRLLGRDQVEPRHRNLRAVREVLHHRLDLGHRARLDGLGPARLAARACPRTSSRRRSSALRAPTKR